MSEISKIEWTNATWNPITGCRRVSLGCQNCYAERFANRFRGVKGHPFEQGFKVKLWRDRLEMPLGWKHPKRVFVNSMSDLFLEQVSDSFILRVFQTMKKADWHTYQILTKRAERMYDLLSNSPKAQSFLSPFPNHIWLGVSVERNDYAGRIGILKKVNCLNKFVSFEPLIGQVKNLNGILNGIDWVIVGGESGSNARPMEKEWVEDIFQICMSKGIPFFFKQWGEFDELGKRTGKKLAGRMYKGRIWDQFPIGQQRAKDRV